jgi:hypothetical protein
MHRELASSQPDKTEQGAPSRVAPVPLRDAYREGNPLDGYQTAARRCSRQAAILHDVEQNPCPSLVAKNGSEQCSQIKGCLPTILAFRSRRSSSAIARSRQFSQRTGLPSGRSARNVWQRTQLNPTPPCCLLREREPGEKIF